MPRLFGPRQVAQTFLTGVIAILPLALTFAILSWLVVLLHDLSGPSSTCGKILQSLGLSLVACELTAYLIGVVGAVLAVYCLGILIESNAGRRLQTTMDDALDRVPVLGTVYHASKQVTSVFDNDPESRQSMSPVLCYFGEGRSTVVPALMPTQEVVHLGDKQYHVVMIPTAPVPFSGALICVEASMVEKADCGFDDLVSMYMSLGMTAPRCLNQEQHKTQDVQPILGQYPHKPAVIVKRERMSKLMSTSDEQRIARKFHKFGWLGFWTQAILAILPLVMLGYMLLGKATSASFSLGFMDYLALVGLLILLFTTFWSFRYTRLARRIADPELRPEWTSVAKTLRVGLWAGCVGLVVSVLLIVIEVLRLLFLFLKTPQAGVPVIQTQADSRTAWVSAMDVVSLLAEICTLVGELFVIALTLWLLFTVLKHVGVFGRLDDPAADA